MVWTGETPEDDYQAELLSNMDTIEEDESEEFDSLENEDWYNDNDMETEES